MGNSFQISQSSHPTLITPFPAYVSFQGINLEKNLRLDNLSNENKFTHKNLVDLMSSLSEEVLSNMYLIKEKHTFYLNKYILNSDDISDEIKDQKCREVFKRLFSALYATSLRHNKNEEYTKETGSIYFCFLFSTCLNIMFSAVLIMCSISLPLVLASFLILTLKFSLDLKNHLANTYKSYHDLYLNQIDDLNKGTIMPPPAQTPPYKSNSTKDRSPLCQLSPEKYKTPLRKKRTKKENSLLPLTTENLLQYNQQLVTQSTPNKMASKSSDSLYSIGKTTNESPSSHSGALSQNHLPKSTQTLDSPSTTSQSTDSERSPTTSTDSLKISSFSQFKRETGPVPSVSSEKHEYNGSKPLPGPLPGQLTGKLTESLRYQ